ncbi:hypothetical protein CRUP_018923 [Coryphaenoides rupestris]|nr:hypothetical protein CRUP_018923 [Coryphaenoides rupestris]
MARVGAAGPPGPPMAPKQRTAGGVGAGGLHEHTSPLAARHGAPELREPSGPGPGSGLVGGGGGRASAGPSEQAGEGGEHAAQRFAELRPIGVAAAAAPAAVQVEAGDGRGRGEEADQREQLGGGGGTTPRVQQL